MRLANRSGLTILELLVALALSASLLVAGRALMEQMAGVSETIATKSAADDSARVRIRSLRAIVRNMSVVSDSSSNFIGDQRTARFASWCTGASAAGAYSIVDQRCDVTLAIDSVVTVTDAAGRKITSIAGGPGVLRYLRDSRDGGHWDTAWGPGIYLPLAIGLILRGDTVVLRIGDRG